MQRLRRCGVLAAALAIAAPVVPALDDPFPGIASAYLVSIQDQPLWGFSVDRRLPPASLTKLMAALLIAEDRRPSEYVVVSVAAARETGARLGLNAGERMTVDDLLAATLIRSANDACHALAEWHSGTEAAFVARINRRAEELELSNTRFTNACGHDSTGHYSSARDLARLSEAALQHPRLAALVATPATRVVTQRGRRFDLVNSNALLGRLPGAIGVKSGYTPKAGKCVIALAERDGIRVLVVLLNAPDRWWNAHELVERAYAERATTQVHWPRPGVEGSPMIRNRSNDSTPR